MAVATLGTAALVGGIIAGAGAVGSAAIQSRQASKAARAQERATDRAMSIEEQNEARRREEFDRTESENRMRWEVEQQREQERYETGRNDGLRSEAAGNARWKFDQDRRKTYRAAGNASVEELTRLAGLTMRETTPPPDLSQGWDEASMSPPTSTPPFIPKTGGVTGGAGGADPRVPTAQPRNRTMASLG